MLELLKGAAKAGQRTGSEALPAGVLTFELVYRSAPDLDAERERIEMLLGGDGFDLFHFSVEDDPDILVLQFVQVERQQSPSFLFETAEELRQALDLEVVTPEIDAQWRDSQTTDAGTEAVGEAVWNRCISKAEPPADPQWTRVMVKADQASAKYGVDGSGILVGQPDTGVADHRELDGGLRTDLGYNFVEDNVAPFDPLSISMGSPGHGTSTSSCVISRKPGLMEGTAPGAHVVPIRCVDSVIIGSGTAVAKSIDHARKKGCHVITMSLGGPIPGFALRRAIRRAVNSGMIVLAAAGNCVGMVVYPAWDKRVIAVAGIDENRKRWKGSSRGGAVEIAAPGENVHVARRKPLEQGQTPDPEEVAKDGQGTSFAVATTAGCAALWLQKHGIGAVKAEAEKRGITVQDLFRSALKATADQPPGWDTDNMGAGIVDCVELCAMELDDVPVPGPVSDAHPSSAILGTNVESALEPEAGFVAMDWWLRQNENRAADLESAVPARPSPRLERAIKGRRIDSFPAPAALAPPATPPIRPEEALKTLASAVKPAIGRANKLDVVRAFDAIQPADINPIMEIAREVLFDPANPDIGLIDQEYSDQALIDLEGTLEVVARTSASNFDPAAFSLPVALPEAVIMLAGRPVIPVSLNGRKDWSGSGNDDILHGPRAGDWASELFPRRNAWRSLVNAVGRVDFKTGEDWQHAGTGFVIAPGIVMTNRHVVQEFAEPIPTGTGTQHMELQKEVSIVFDSNAQDDATRFKVKSVLAAGKNRIGRFVNLANLDMALLEIETDNGQNTTPDPIGISSVPVSDQSRSLVLVAGYPARPPRTAAPADSTKRSKYWDRLHELYGGKYGIKYIAPGEIMSRPGQITGDSNLWTFSHDCTTLGGSSGSLILTLDDDMKVCGLHFGGATLAMNLAHDFGVATTKGDASFSLAELGLA